MAPLPFLGPTPVLVNGRAFDPLLTHEWISAPDSSHRKRTLVLCFDGTGESFDADVSWLEPIIWVVGETEGGTCRIQTSRSSWQC